ncbi:MULTISPECIES: hypothetical protein [unclassified Mesorhizobium]|uniref:hypothetical protein n=1 Tax=unclassified Mesorhizobium TaxID=325217 RepID=UPI001FED7A49|nr:MULTISPECIES: hypothetical protein [unclassified Mesorhizobium]
MTADSAFTTRSEFHFEVRLARPEDEPTLAEFFVHVTPDDLRFRFLDSHERLVAMTRSDDAHIHFFAFSDDGMLIAVAMLASDPADRNGEVAICIRADRHLGVGWELLAYIAS